MFILRPCTSFKVFGQPLTPSLGASVGSYPDVYGPLSSAPVSFWDLQLILGTEVAAIGLEVEERE